MAKKWTNERIDTWLADNQKSFCRVTNFELVTQPSTALTTWKCSIDGHEWQARVDNIVGKGSGCPKCSGNIELTTDVINERIATRSEATCLEIYAGTYLNSRRGLFQCNKCNDTWDANIHNVIKFGYGCPVCNANIGSPCKSEDGIKFHSKLERTFWETVYPLVSAGLVVEKQVRYTPTRRFTADFYIPTISTYVEISGTALLKRQYYTDTMDQKKSIAVEQHREHVVLTSIPQINEFVKRLQQV